VGGLGGDVSGRAQRCWVGGLIVISSASQRGRQRPAVPTPRRRMAVVACSAKQRASRTERPDGVPCSTGRHSAHDRRIVRVRYRGPTPRLNDSDYRRCSVLRSDRHVWHPLHRRSSRRSPRSGTSQGHICRGHKTWVTSTSGRLILEDTYTVCRPGESPSGRHRWQARQLIPTSATGTAVSRSSGISETPCEHQHDAVPAGTEGDRVAAAQAKALSALLSWQATWRL
jgi:hypothetical protein